MGKRTDPSTQADNQHDEPQLKFEEAVERVESIIEQIESGQIGLEESLSEYERATKLLAGCKSILATAQKRIAKLAADAEGRLSVEEG